MHDLNSVTNMELEREFQRNRSNSQSELIIGLVASILLHSIVLIGATNWVRSAEHKQKLSSSIPIEFVEVPPQAATPPPKTKLRAANDSVARGIAKPKQPISAAKSLPVEPRASSTPKNSPDQPALSMPIKPSKAVLPRYPQQAISKTAPLPTISKLKPKSPNTAVATTPEPNPEKAPTLPATLKPQLTQSQNNLPSPKLASEQLERITPNKTQAQAQPSQISGAASRLGGPVSLSSRSIGNNYLAAVPNSNRSNQGTLGIDARREVDIGAYLQQLQQRVRRQWIPGMAQSSQKTVVYFVVSRSGQVSNIQIVQPSRSNVTDSVALSAIERAAPFAPLPVGYSKDYIKILFTFNINVSGELDLSAH